MRILVLSQYWNPENGVPQRRWSWLTEILQNAGHEVVAVVPPPHYKRMVSIREWVASKGFCPERFLTKGEKGETLLRSGYFPAGNSLTKRIFNQAWTAFSMLLTVVRPTGPLRDYRPDVVIGTVPALPTAAVTFLAAKRFGTPFIIDLRDAWPALFRESSNWNTGTGTPSIREQFFTRGPLQILVKVTEKMLERVLGAADGIITTSAALQALLSQQYDAQIATVRNVFPSPPSVLRKDVPDNKRQLRVLYAGTLGRAQKLENALVAAKIAQENGIDVELRFVGDGATWDALRTRAAELEINFHLEHQRNPDDLLAHYEWADTALVHLTEWDSLRAAVPSKTYELMTNRIHISGVVSGETANLITSLKAGDVVPPNNPQALAELWVRLTNNRSRLVVGDEGRRWVERERKVEAPAALLSLLERCTKSQ